MKNLLNYISGKMPEDNFTKKLETAVSTQKLSEDGRHDYMLMVDKLAEIRAEGRAEGFTEGKIKTNEKTSKLIGILTDNNNLITLKEISKNPELLEQLFKKY